MIGHVILIPKLKTTEVIQRNLYEVGVDFCVVSKSMARSITLHVHDICYIPTSMIFESQCELLLKSTTAQIELKALEE